MEPDEILERSRGVMLAQWRELLRLRSEVLKTSDLEAIRAGAQMIGIVNRPGRQPQHLSRQRGQGLQAVGLDRHFALAGSAC